MILNDMKKMVQPGALKTLPSVGILSFRWWILRAHRSPSVLPKGPPLVSQEKLLEMDYTLPKKQRARFDLMIRLPESDTIYHQSKISRVDESSRTVLYYW